VTPPRKKFIVTAVTHCAEADVISLTLGQHPELLVPLYRELLQKVIEFEGAMASSDKRQRSRFFKSIFC
jgi:hypothetical protein